MLSWFLFGLLATGGVSPVACAVAGGDIHNGEVMRQHARTLVRRESAGVANQRRSALRVAEDCIPYPGKRVVLVAVDSDFADFFDNWLQHAAKFLTPKEQVVAIADDAQVLPKLHKLRNVGHRPFFDILEAEPLAASALEISEAATPYGTTGYNNLMHSRPRHLVRFVQQGCAVLYVDVDTVWLKNPFADIDSAGAHDLYVVDDGSNGGSELPKPLWDAHHMAAMQSQSYDCKNQMPNFCGCFQYIKPTKAMVEFARDWSKVSLSGLYKNEGNQRAFNQMLCNHVQESSKNHTDLTFAVLPWKKFPPGPVAKVSPEDVTIVHANWLAGHTAKVSFLKQLGLWNVSEVV